MAFLDLIKTDPDMFELISFVFANCKLYVSNTKNVTCNFGLVSVIIHRQKSMLSQGEDLFSETLIKKRAFQS